MTGAMELFVKRWLIAAVITIVGSMMVTAEFFNNKPAPHYSLTNMPRTSFSCRGKILGGYYADPETQCQMFHVCVKVAGVGVQDFRFLCPNNTAFDQEAQTCAGFYDVDCEQSTLYYGSDNFDLYRIGSGFESKRAPFADEEEATFHLQRAESNDARRSKLTIVNQASGPEKISLYNGQALASQNSNNFGQHTGRSNSQQFKGNQQTAPTPSANTLAKPVVNSFANIGAEPQKIFKKPSSTTTSTTTTTTTTTTRKPISRAPNDQSFYGRREENNKDSDDIFKGSHSSNFFNNRHGKDDDYEDAAKSSYVPSTSTARSNQRGRQRGRVHYQKQSNSADINSLEPSANRQQTVGPRVRGTTTTTTTTYRPPTSRPQPFQQQQPIAQKSAVIQPPSAHFSAPVFDYNRVQATSAPPTTKPVVASVVPLKIVVSDIKPQEKQHFFTNPTQSLHRQTIGNNGILPLTNSTTERSRKDPFKVTYDTKFLNNQDAFNYQLNQEFQPSRQLPPSTTTTTTSTTSTTTTIAPPTYNRNPPIDGLRLNQNQFNHFAQQQQLAGQHKSATESAARGISFVQSQQQENIRYNPNAYTADVAPTKLQVDNFNNLERTVQQLQKSINKAAPAGNYKESRTLLSAFGFAPQATTFNPSQYSRATQSPLISSSPRGFAATLQPNVTTNHANTAKDITSKSSKDKTHITLNANSKFASRSNENYTPSSVKRFSTLVPRDNYSPTTFKPVEGFAVSQFQQQLQSQNSRYLNSLTFSQPPPFAASSTSTTTSSTTTTTTTTTTKAPTTFAPRTNAPIPVTTQTPRLLTTTQRPLPITTTVTPVNIGDIDEDDGQYHPELYEQDFAKNKLKRLRQQNESNKPGAAAKQVTQHTHNFNNHANKQLNYQQFQANQQNQFNSASPVPQTFSNAVTNSGEDEFLHTAHSQNIAASQNELRQQAAVKASAVATNKSRANQHQHHSAPKTLTNKAPTIPPNATSTRKPTTKAEDKDASYDYAYYDSANENAHSNDYSEYGIITDFGKTKN